MSAHAIVHQVADDEAERLEQTEQSIIEVLRAWRAYQPTEKYGLAFGKACYEFRLRVVTCGGVGNKGKGFVPTLEQLNIPTSTAYWWMDRYEVSAGLKPPPPEPEDRDLDGTEYSSLTMITEILDSAEPTVCHWPRITMDIAQQINASSPRSCWICKETQYHPCLCTNCGWLVCDHCWPNHKAGHPANLDLYRVRSELLATQTPDQLLLQVELALINLNALKLWPRENSPKLRKSVVAILDSAVRQIRSLDAKALAEAQP